MPLRRSITLAVALLATLGPGVATAQTTTGNDQPQAVEPVPGKVAPAPAPDANELLPTVTEPAAPTTTAPPTTQTQAAPPTQPQAATPAEKPAADQHRGVGWPTLAAIALAAVASALLVLVVLWRWRGWDPRWIRRWRHATGEAGLRLSLGWAEFRDFIRLGR